MAAGRWVSGCSHWKVLRSSLDRSHRRANARLRPCPSSVAHHLCIGGTRSRASGNCPILTVLPAQLRLRSPTPGPARGRRAGIYTCHEKGEPKAEIRGLRRALRQNRRDPPREVGRRPQRRRAMILGGEPVVDIWGSHVDRACATAWERGTITDVLDDEDNDRDVRGAFAPMTSRQGHFAAPTGFESVSSPSESGFTPSASARNQKGHQGCTKTCTGEHERPPRSSGLMGI